MLTAMIGIVVLLGGLIFFHEFGHYSVAKFFGVKVEVFSLGFGKKLLKKVIGETEYCLSVFPLGGYVKLMGDDPYKEVPASEAHRAFSTQKLYKRFLIVAAGPIANLFLAILLTLFVNWVGRPVIGTKIGTVVVDSPAWKAGLRARDRILSVAGTPKSTWDDIEEGLKNIPNQPIELQVERSGELLNISVTVDTVPSRNFYGQEELVGGLKGVFPTPLAPVVGISDPESIAAKAGLLSGDQISKVGNQNIEVYEDIHETLSKLWNTGEPITVTVIRGDSSEEKSFVLTIPKVDKSEVSAFGLGEFFGLYPSEQIVENISKDSPAEKGGLLSGDRVVSLNDSKVFNFESTVDLVQEAGKSGTPIHLTIERSGKLLTLLLKPEETTLTDPLTREDYKRYLIGFAPKRVFASPEMIPYSIKNPVLLLSTSLKETYELSERMLLSLVKLAVGEISVKNLGGPVLIASVAGKSLDAGIIPFLQMMSLISINLFLLNLFPIPILDGGHLLFFAIEGIKGRPVSIRTMELANQVGMVFILMLVGLTLFNDISRMVAN